MTEEAPAAPAGWYPSPSGQQRYWDGTQWLDLPTPQNEHEGSEAGAENAPQRKRLSSKKWVAIGIVALILVAGGVSATVWKFSSDAQIAAAEALAVEEAQNTAKREADAEAAQKRRDDAERASRIASVDGIEQSVKTMAEKHVTEEVIDGPILEATCSPLGGGSTDDLTENTTVFECFVATVDNGDGTMSGYTYNATMNWTTGSYTYGLGAP